MGVESRESGDGDAGNFSIETIPSYSLFNRSCQNPVETLQCNVSTIRCTAVGLGVRLDDWVYKGFDKADLVSSSTATGLRDKLYMSVKALPLCAPTDGGSTTLLAYVLSNLKG
ncbi:MAG TPA: hypothetical protein DCY91_09200 [Cyanobacteria bacterium UBA11370]|nr:hypothetical protein [Cyanobacteria bacterium UBA11370]